MTEYTTGEAPKFGAERLLFAVTGSAFASALPYWFTWLRMVYPDLEVKAVVTRSAQQFVTRQALRLRSNSEVLVDEWSHEAATALHIELAEWSDAMIVYPATLHFTARLALGLGDSPLVLAAQCTSRPIAVAPALPPGGLDSAAFREHWTTLIRRPNVVMVAPQHSYSLTTGEMDSWTPPPLPEVVRRLEDKRQEIASHTGVFALPVINDRRSL